MGELPFCEHKDAGNPDRIDDHDKSEQQRVKQGNSLDSAKQLPVVNDKK
jgi:hypothetical protein